MIETQTETRTRAARRVMSIEAALQWAYRIELPNRTDSADNIGWAPTSGQHPMWREVVDGGNGGAGFVPRFEPHPDAVTIDQVVQSLADPLNWTDAVEFPLLGEDGFGLSGLEWQLLNTAIRGARALVIANAVLAKRPDALSQPEGAPMTYSNGKVMMWEMQIVKAKMAGGLDVEYAEEMLVHAKATRNKAAKYPDGAYTKNVWSISPEAVLRDRADYSCWWAALNWLAGELGGLVSIDVQGMAGIDPQPWRV